MCFVVVLCHYWTIRVHLTGVWKFINWLRPLAVPVFMIASFYCMYFKFKNLNTFSLKRRIIQLYIPVVFWSGFYVIGYNLLSYTGMAVSKPNIYNFLWQVFTGHNLNAPMWFNMVLILLTVGSYALFYYCKNKKCSWISILIGIMLCALFMQYSGMNYRLFGSLRFELKYPLGRIVEMIPIAAVGLILAWSNILNLFAKYRYVVLCYSGLFIMFIYRYKCFSSTPRGYSYSGIELLISALIFFVGFYNLDFAIRKIQLTKTLVVFLNKYIMGIYCVHVFVGTFLNNVIYPYYGLRGRSFSQCVIIFVIGLLISFLLNKFTSKHFRLV